jgi:hypothetical protein
VQFGLFHLPNGQKYAVIIIFFIVFLSCTLLSLSKLKMQCVPAVVLPTYMNHLLYSTSDLQNDYFSNFCLVDCSDFIGKDYEDLPSRDLIYVPSNQNTILSFRGIHGVAFSCDSDGLGVLTRSGRRKLTFELYLKRAEIEIPKFYVTMGDEVFEDIFEF